MRIKLATIALLVAHPAMACHKYSIWHYPYPQKCYPSHSGMGTSHYVDVPEALPPPKPVEFSIPSLDQFTDPPTYDEDLTRHVGIEQLKELLKKGQ